MFKRIVTVIEVLALAGALFFVVMLFGNEGGGTLTPSAAVYDANCASCHGGDGGGGLGPQLAGVVEEKYPDIEDQIAFVEEGQGAMPGFSGSLSDDEIRQVVEYTRSLK
ncbi:MAG: cytochrome c [Actinobacteria bacterium]|nr:cytochrome c [Actinomycetota bacterium]